jgi:hypothetical protein
MYNTYHKIKLYLSLGCLPAYGLQATKGKELGRRYGKGNDTLN